MYLSSEKKIKFTELSPYTVLRREKQTSEYIYIYIYINFYERYLFYLIVF